MPTHHSGDAVPRVPSRALLVCLLTAFALMARTAEASESDAIPMDTLVQLALTDNPRLRALFEDWEVTFARASAARNQMPQPRVTYTAYLQAVQTREGAMRHQFMLSQTFPWFRALRDAADPFADDAAALAAQFDAATLEVVYAVRLAGVELARLDALRALMVEKLSIYNDMLTHLEAVMAYSPVEHGDVLRTALMVDVAHDAIARLDAQRDAELARLAGLTRVPNEGFDVVRPALDSMTGPWEEQSPDRDSVVTAMEANHPVFRVFSARTHAAIERAEAANNARLPEPTVSVGWTVINALDGSSAMGETQGRDAVTVSLSMPIPVFRRQFGAATEAALAVGDRNAADAESQRWAMVAQIDAALVRMADARGQIERLQRDLLPAVRDVTDHYRIALTHGDATHTDLLLALEQEVDLATSMIESQATLARDTLLLLTLMASDVPARADDAPLQIDTYGEDHE